MAQEDTKTSAAALKAIQAAAKGLRYQSESDKPVKAVLWKKEDIGANATPTAAVQKAAVGKPVKSISVDDFFAPMTTPQAWHGDEEKATCAHFQTLASTLKEHLSDLAAFRVGGEDDTTIDAYVVGGTADGDVAGISTQLVET